MDETEDFFGEASFGFEGEQYTLTLCNKALFNTERVLGESMLDFVPELQHQLAAGRKPRVGVMSALIYGGLAINHPYIDEQFAIRLARGSDQQFLTALSKAMRAAFPAEDNQQGKPSPPARKKQVKRKAVKKGGAGSA